MLTVVRVMKSEVMSQSSADSGVLLQAMKLEHQRREKELLAIDPGRVVLLSGHTAQGFNPPAERSAVLWCSCA